MKTLIVGHYGQQTEADNAARELLRAGFHPSGLGIFYYNPQGQHATYPIGGDENESPGTHQAKGGAVRGAVGGVGAGTLVGAATIPVLGPAAPLFGAAVGAYTGSLVGALKNMEESDEDASPPPQAGTRATPAEPRKAGIMLAVAVATADERQVAVEVLGARADEVEEAQGTLQNGDWVDFDPLAPRKLLDTAATRT